MPEITVSERLYHQLRAAAGNDVDETTLWRMLHQFKRRQVPSE